MVSVKEIIPEIVAGFIAIIVIVFDAAIVAYELVHDKAPQVPDVFSNLTFAVIAVYFTQQAAQRAITRTQQSIAQGTAGNGVVPDATKPQPPA